MVEAGVDYKRCGYGPGPGPVSEETARRVAAAERPTKDTLCTVDR